MMRSFFLDALLAGLFSATWLVPAFADEPAAPASQPAATIAPQSDKPSLAGPRPKAIDQRPGLRARAGRNSRPGADKPGLGGMGAGFEDSFLTDEQIDRLMQFMEKNFPVMHDRLDRARERDPAAFKRMIHRSAKVMLPMLRAAAENPELSQKMVAEHRAQLNIQDLREKYAHTQDTAERSRLREQIRSEMEAGFEARISRLRMEVKQLQQRLDQARQNLASQEKNKDKYIDSRLSDVLNEP